LTSHPTKSPGELGDSAGTLTSPAAAIAGALPSTRRLGGGVFADLLRRPRFVVPAFVVLVLCVMAIVPQAFAGWFGHGDPRSCQLEDSGLGPRSGHPFGFDIQGCDLYSNVVYGARNSISIGLLTTAITLVVAVVLGTLSCYFGGFVDATIGRVMDVFFGFPLLVGMIVVLETFTVHSVFTVSLVLALFAWPPLTRVMRSSVLAVRNLEYVTAARELGAGPVRIMVRHVGPNAIAPVAVLTSLNVGAVITAEAALTFLGVGLQAPSISWGVQLNAAQQYFTTNLNVLIFPALFLSLAVLGFVMMGDALRDALDPKLR
jgi:ABC-type dipeptide/oligopeptide/nickel transport system permease subunit